MATVLSQFLNVPLTLRSHDGNDEFEQIRAEMFDAFSKVNDTSLSVGERVKFRDEMYQNLHRLFDRCDFETYSELYENLRNNDIDNNFEKYFRLAA